VNSQSRVGDHGLTKPLCKRRELGKAARLWWVLWRISRDKWLSPDDLYKRGMAFAKCLDTDHAERLLLNAVQSNLDVQESSTVGMLRGYAAFQPWECGYDEFRAFMRVMKRPKALPPELVILRLKLKGKAYGR
jgi:hypothetical protein